MPYCALSINGRVWWLKAEEKAEPRIRVRLLDRYDLVFERKRVNRNGIYEYVLVDIEEVDKDGNRI